MGLEAAQPLGRAIQQEYLRIHGGGDPGRIPAHTACSQHHHPRWPHPGAAPHQDAATAVGALQQVGPHLGCQPTGDFAHRRQQGQAAVFELHGFVGHCRGASLQQGPAHLRVGGQVQVGEQHQIGAQKAEFLGLGLLDLHHQMGAPGFCGAHQPGPGGGEGGIAEASP